ncbi:histidine kinase [Bradyrhizobium sp. WSM471]|uniref:histidine kinase n=1 Tax=Bradyrhizobium sp. WSM471 TaxID=319017 RepID=UPI0009FFE560|nr:MULTISPECIES: histidine kinase [Bradyrhizobium]UFW38564.1 histidine kinase [Bradyrhizobium canariense]
MLKTEVRGGRILMYSYHIVAELRQFRGATAATDPRIHSDMPDAGTDSSPHGLTGMHKFFLAMMVSAVLLLIVAADLLVNGLGVQEPNANVASAIQVAGRFVR